MTEPPRVSDVPVRHEEAVRNLAVRMTPGGLKGASAQVRPVTPQQTMRGKHTSQISTDPIVIGIGASATDHEGIAVGNGATSGGAASIAEGYNAAAAGDHAAAFGESADASGAWATAVGADAKATGDNSGAFGVAAEAGGAGALAFGLDAKAYGTNAIAFLGVAGTSGAPLDGAVAILATAVRANDLMLGGGSHVVIINGILVLRNDNGHYFKLNIDDSGVVTGVPYTYP